ncbi:MAG TPA: AlpA family phage regulatory protein [Caulobacteraceae bacterium]|jgi:predicted DNA-binding transcriptional regulator AlpA
MTLDTDSNTATGPGGPGDRLLPWAKVRDITGLSRTTAWRRQKAGDFPLAIQISPGRVGWWESELTAWSTSRAPRRPAPVPAESRAAAPPKPIPPPLPEHPRPRANAPAVVGEPARSPRRRGGCEGQIAFEF